MHLLRSSIFTLNGFQTKKFSIIGMHSCKRMVLSGIIIARYKVEYVRIEMENDMENGVEFSSLMQLISRWSIIII